MRKWEGTFAALLKAALANLTAVENFVRPPPWVLRILPQTPILQLGHFFTAPRDSSKRAGILALGAGWECCCPPEGSPSRVQEHLLPKVK